MITLGKLQYFHLHQFPGYKGDFTILDHSHYTTRYVTYKQSPHHNISKAFHHFQEIRTTQEISPYKCNHKATK